MGLLLSWSIVAHGILVLALTLVFLRQGWLCYDQYKKAETSVKMQIKKHEDTRFPAIAISPSWNLSAMGSAF